MAWSVAAAIAGLVVGAAAGPFLLTAQITFAAQQAAETRLCAETQLTAPLLPTALAITVPTRGVAGAPKRAQNAGRPDDGRGSGVR
jgi:hypothetical protein